MNRMHPANTGAAVAITIAIGYALCTLVFVAFPDASVAFLNSLFHGLDFRKLQPAAGGFSAAGFSAVLVVWAIYGFLLGALYAWVSNRLGRWGRSRGSGQPTAASSKSTKWRQS